MSSVPTPARSVASPARSRFVAVFVHVLLVLFFFFLPEMLLGLARPGRFGGYTPWWVYAKSGVMVAVFYLNYFLIIDRTVVRRHRWWQFVALNVVLVVAAVMLMHWITAVGFEPRPRHHHPHEPRMIASFSFMFRDAVMLLLTVSLALALRLSAFWKDMERRRTELLAASRESELEGLRAQLNPHFLFNTLNSIYALIDISPDEARDAVHRLSQLLRHVVYQNSDRVPLATELDFIADYTALMRLRLGDRPVRLSIESAAPQSATVPPLIFLTLVENAFKHGNTAHAADPISITVDAGPESVTCTTVNHIDLTARRDNGPGGVGLANLRRRLELIFGRSASLEITTEQSTFTTRLTLPYETPA